MEIVKLVLDVSLVISALGLWGVFLDYRLHWERHFSLVLCYLRDLDVGSARRGDIISNLLLHMDSRVRLRCLLSLLYTRPSSVRAWYDRMSAFPSTFAGVHSFFFLS